jgi:hypothetical protein
MNMQELFLSTLTLLQLGRYGHIDIRLIVNPDLLKNNNNKETKRTTISDVEVHQNFKKQICKSVRYYLKRPKLF